MSQTRPYQFGDVVDGHRWTVAGWERIDPPAPEPAPETEPEPVRTVHAAPDLRIELDEGEPDLGSTVVPHLDVALDQPLDAAPEPVDDAFADVVALARSGLAHHDEDTHTWSDAAWEAIDEWTGSAPEPPRVIVLPTEPAVAAVVAEQRRAPAAETRRAVALGAAPAAGWYPGATPTGP